MAKLYHGQGSMDTREYSNRRQTVAATYRMTLQISQSIRHAASAGRASPLHTNTAADASYDRARCLALQFSFCECQKSCKLIGTLYKDMSHQTRWFGFFRTTVEVEVPSIIHCSLWEMLWLLPPLSWQFGVIVYRRFLLETSRVRRGITT